MFESTKESNISPLGFVYVWSAKWIIFSTGNLSKIVLNTSVEHPWIGKTITFGSFANKSQMFWISSFALILSSYKSIKLIAKTTYCPAPGKPPEKVVIFRFLKKFSKH